MATLGACTSRAIEGAPDTEEGLVPGARIERVVVATTVSVTSDSHPV